MKALRKMKAGRGVALESVAAPEPGPAEVVVRVRAASICGTDVHIYGWDRWSAGRIRPPVTLGHEFCGYVERAGSEVEAVRAGDFVSAEMHVACGFCRPCRMGQAHVCVNLRILGIDADGCFAEFVKIPARNIWKIDAAIPERYAAILDPLGNAVHAVLAGEIAGRTVLVTGAGPIGLMAIGVARACGCARIMATEVHPRRRALALEMGADQALDPGDPQTAGRVREATGGAGADVLLEMSGAPAALQQGFELLRPGGRASLLGIPHEPFALDLVNSVILKGATVHGIYGRRMFETWVQMTELLRQGRLNMDPLFRERLPLEKFEDAFALLESGEAGKILLYPNGAPK